MISVREKIYIILAATILAGIPFMVNAQFGSDEILSVPTRETQNPLPVRLQDPQQTQNPVWLERMEQCTQAQKEDENFALQFQPDLVQKQLDETAAREYARVVKARQDVNKLIASTYNELQTQQIVKSIESVDTSGNTTYPADPDFKSALQTIGIAVVDDSATAKDPATMAKSAVCKAGNSVLASVSENNDDPQCVAIVQESRIITNEDDYIYEEGRRKAMDALFCYLGDWRHFPLANYNDPANCAALDNLKGDDCTVQKQWEKLATLLGKDPNYFNDVDGTKTPNKWDDDQSDYNFCEGMRALGKKCAQDVLRDEAKYETIDSITRNPRTVALAPPQTWYTPDRCRVLSNFLAGPGKPTKAGEPGDTSPSAETLKAYSPNLKSLNLVNPDTFTSSFEWIDYYFGSPFGNTTIHKSVSDMNPAEYSPAKEFSVLTVSENDFYKLRDKALDLAQGIITETTDLRKLQYASGQGLRDATLRIGWRDFNWKETTTPGDKFLEKYDALDYAAANPKHSNKIYKPLPCYWQNEGKLSLCDDKIIDAKAKPDGPMFYFDTGIVLSPAILLKDKLQSAIQAQFDLARDTFALPIGSTIIRREMPAGAGCNVDKTVNWVAPALNTLPAPWEDPNIDSGSDYSKESLIPYIEGNYFNALYNDVFQLYHTPFPIQLEQWFATGNPEPTYESVYDKTTTELKFLEDMGSDGGGDPYGPSRFGGPVGPLPKGCNNYKDLFKSVGDKEGCDPCFLEGIAAAESSCDPQAHSKANAYGITQFLSGSASEIAGRTITGSELQGNPELAIRLTCRYLKKYKPIVDGYGFPSASPDEQLIASYNAGASKSCSAPGATNPGIMVKKAFCPSKDDPGKPVWQAPGAYQETKDYVPRVQNFRNKCNI